jgi:catechol-2,3-dioxygenase
MTHSTEPYFNRMVPELSVTDFPAYLRFYAEVLGFKVMIIRSDSDFAYVCLGKAQLMLEQYHVEGCNTGELIRSSDRS